MTSKIIRPISNWLVVDGMDGAGKTQVVKKLYSFFEDNNIEVNYSREPGGTPWSEKMRDLLKNPNLVKGEKGGLTAETELTGMYSSRFNLHRKVIKPGLERGIIQVTDRFDSSSYAYQVYPNPYLIDLFESLNRAGDFCKRKYIFMDVSYENSMARRDNRGIDADAIEKRTAGKDKFKELREGMLEFFIKYHPDDHIIIDTNEKSQDEVWENVLKSILI